MRYLFLLLLVGCTTLTEEQKYAREDAFAKALDDYEVRVRNCSGFMVRRFTQKQLDNRRVHPAELALAYCVERGYEY